MLTCMGANGATVMRVIKEQGAWNIAKTGKHVVFGVPREAINAGAALDVFPLPHGHGRPHPPQGGSPRLQHEEGRSYRE